MGWRHVLVLSLLLGGAAAGCTSREKDAAPGPIERLNTQPGTLGRFTFPYYTAIHALPGGGAIAVWMRQEEQFRPLVSRRAGAATGVFGDESYLSPEDLRQTISILPKVLGGQSPGELFAIWQARQPTSGNKFVVFRRSQDGGASWGTAHRVNSEPTAFIPALAADPDGAIYAVWTDERANGIKVYFNRSLDRGETWMAADLRVDGGGERPGAAISASVASDGAGQVVVVWEEQAKKGRRVHAVSSQDRGATWSQPSTVDDDTDPYSPSAPAVAFASGRAVALWTTAASGLAARLWADSSADGGRTWGTDVLVQETTKGVPPRVHLVSDGQTARAVFHAGLLQGSWHIYYAETGPDGSWSALGDALPRVSQGEGKFANPRLAVASAGDLYVAYEEDRRRIMLNRSTDGGKSWGAAPLVIDAVGEGEAEAKAKAIVRYPQVAVGDGVAYVMWEGWAETAGSFRSLAETETKILPSDLFVRRVTFRR